jgi:alpha-L-fucosidase
MGCPDQLWPCPPELRVSGGQQLYRSTGAESAWPVDVMKEIAEACHAADMKLNIYYSQPDWHHPDFCGEHHERYIAYLHGQIRELLTHSGRIDGLWFDELGANAKQWDAENFFKPARDQQPRLLINNRRGLPGDSDTPEQQVRRSEFDRPGRVASRSVRSGPGSQTMS